jgi:hypothetical protein
MTGMEGDLAAAGRELVGQEASEAAPGSGIGGCMPDGFEHSLETQLSLDGLGDLYSHKAI